MDWLVPIRRDEFSGLSGWSRLLTMVEQDMRATNLITLVEPLQLMLKRDSGLTASNGMRINVEAFAQICSLMAGGLYRNLSQLYELSDKPNAEKRVGIIQAYNSLLQISFARFVGSRIVVDRQTNCVVGLVGSKYQYVANARLLQEISPWVAGADKPAYRLLSGKLRNRDLRVVLVRSNESVTERQIRYAQGIAVYNSETTRRAIYLPQIVIDSETNSFAMAPETRGNRMIHRKRANFGNVLNQVVQTAIKHDLMLPEWLSAIRILRRTPIRPLHENAVAYTSVERRLVAKDLNTGTVELVLRFLREAAGDEAPTRWQLYRALVMAAKQYADSERVLRQLAFGLIEKSGVGT